MKYQIEHSKMGFPSVCTYGENVGREVARRTPAFSRGGVPKMICNSPQDVFAARLLDMFQFYHYGVLHRRLLIGSTIRHAKRKERGAPRSLSAPKEPSLQVSEGEDYCSVIGGQGGDRNIGSLFISTT